MSWGWFVLILYVILAGGLITMIISNLVTYIMMPFAYMSRKSFNILRYIGILPFLFHGISSLFLPWRLDMDFSVVKYIIAIAINITELVSFGACIALLLNKDLVRED